MKVRELLSDESKWCQHVPARDETGCMCDTHESAAVQWCLMGAVNRLSATFADYHKIQQRLRRHLHMDPSAWNDAPERTFADVRALVDELDI